MALLDSNLAYVLFASLLIYWLLLRRTFYRLCFLSLVSLGVVASVHLSFAVGIVVLTSAVYLSAQFAEKQNKLGMWALLCVGGLLVAMFFGKYGDQIFQNLGLELSWAEKHLVVPLGISYFVFKLIHYVFDIYRGTLENKSFIKLLHFVSFFPILPAGPIETFDHFYKDQSHKFDGALFNWGVRRATWGFFKKIVLLELLISSLFGSFEARVIATPAESMWSAFGFSMLALTKAYIDLSAYTDIALGLSALFGFRVMENFNLPFLARNISEFWGRWHISLSQWCRNNVYFPIFGVTRKPWLATYASMLTMGLWHHMNLSWLCWGLFHATGLTVWANWSRYSRKLPLIDKVGSASLLQPFWMAATFIFVSLGFSFVAIEDFSKSSLLFLTCLGL